MGYYYMFFFINDNLFKEICLTGTNCETKQNEPKIYKKLQTFDESSFKGVLCHLYLPLLWKIYSSNCKVTKD